MAVFIFIDHTEGHVKKTSLEALSYGAAIAAQLGTTAEGILLGTLSSNPADLGKYGVTKIHHAAQETLNTLDARVYARLIADTVAAAGGGVLVFSNNVTGKAVAPRVAVRLKAGLVSGAVALPVTTNGFVVKKTVFSGKAFANISIDTPFKVVALNPNAYAVNQTQGTAEIVPLTATAATASIKVVSTKQRPARSR